MARAKKVAKAEVKVKNPAVFTEVEAASYRKTLIQELEWKSKGTLSIKRIEELADSVINKNEETTLLLRRKGVLFMTGELLAGRNEATVA